MTNLVPFTYEDAQVRVLEIDGEPWFVLADLCAVLGLARGASQISERLDDGVRQTYPILDSLGRTQNATLVSEAGMYEVVIRSDKPEAVKFRRWITGEVLPAIRKTGAYAVPTAPAARAELLSRADLARMVLEAEEEKAVIAAALESAAPAIAYHDRYVANDDAATIKVWGAQFGLSQPQAYDLLIDKGLIYRTVIGERWSERKQKPVTEHEYRAYAKYLDWFDLRPQHNAPRHHNGQVRTTLYVRQMFAIEVAGKCGLAVQMQLERAAA